MHQALREEGAQLVGGTDKSKNWSAESWVRGKFGEMHRCLNACETMLWTLDFILEPTGSNQSVSSRGYDLNMYICIVKEVIQNFTCGDWFGRIKGGSRETNKTMCESQREMGVAGIKLWCGGRYRGGVEDNSQVFGLNNCQIDDDIN